MAIIFTYFSKVEKHHVNVNSLIFIKISCIVSDFHLFFFKFFTPFTHFNTALQLNRQLFA